MSTPCQSCKAAARAVAALGLAVLGPATAGGAGDEPDVRASLVLEVTRFAPGRPFDAGVRLDVPRGWYIYWRNPGDAGLPTEMEWDLPEGFRVGPMEWPVPKRFVHDDLASFGYEGTVVFPVRIIPPADWPPTRPARLRMRVSWLKCRDACVPGSATVERELAAGDSPLEAAEEMAVLRDARRRLPAAAPEVAASYDAKDERLHVWLRELRAGEPGLLIPYEGGFLPPAATPRWRRGPAAGEWLTDLPLAPGFPVPPAWRAILLLEDGRGLELEIRRSGGSVTH